MLDKMHRHSGRERQIMDIIYARGEATATEVQEAMTDAPSYSAIRTLLRILEGKGHLKHRVDGQRYVYAPTHPAAKASQSMLRKVLDTFFAGSLANAVAAMVDARDGPLDAAEIARLEDILRSIKPKKRGKQAQPASTHTPTTPER